jgi:hypothetical protein
MKAAAICLATSLAIGAAGTACANDLKAETKFRDTVVAFEVKEPYSNLTLTIAGPNKFHASASSRGGGLELDLRRSGPVEDGTYTYHLSGATNETVKHRTRHDNGRDRASEARRSVSTSGSFVVQRGVIVPRGPTTGKRDSQ